MSYEEGGYRRVRHRWLIQASVGFGVMLTTVDTGSVNVSLYTIANYFGVDAATVAWLPLVAFLTVTSTVLLFGRLSDMLGSKLIFVSGFGVYALGSLFCGVAPSFPILVASRGLQAVGISMLSANSSAILTECFPPGQRGAALGINSTLVGLGFFIGPIAGGTIIKAFGWHYVFFSTVPLCLLGLVTAWLVLPRSSPSGNLRFDFKGAFLFAISAVSLLLAVNGARSVPFTSPRVWGFAAAAGLAIPAFILVEKRVVEPLLDLSLFRIRLFTFSLVTAFFAFLGIAGQDFLVPLFSQQVLAMDPQTAGMLSSTVPFVRMFVSGPSGFLSDKIGSRLLTAFGCTLTAIGMVGLSRMDAGTSMTWMMGCLTVMGLGTGIFFSPNMHATMSSVPANRLGLAAGALGLRRNLGQSMGVAFTAYLLQSGTGHASASISGFQLAFASQSIYLAVAALCAVAAGSTLRARRPVTASRSAN